MNQLAINIENSTPIKQPSPWSEPVTARLIEIWPHNSGLQCAAILNGEFGILLTRQAVIGKATRIGIASITKTTRHPMDFSHRPRIAKPIALRAPIQRKPRRELPPMACEVPPLNLSLADLPDNGCRFIPGSDLLYCGHEQWKESSYCAFHHRIVYTPPVQKVRTFYSYSGLRR